MSNFIFEKNSRQFKFMSEIYVEFKFWTKFVLNSIINRMSCRNRVWAKFMTNSIFEEISCRIRFMQNSCKGQFLCWIRFLRNLWNSIFDIMSCQIWFLFESHVTHIWVKVMSNSICDRKFCRNRKVIDNHIKFDFCATMNSVFDRILFRVWFSI